MEHAQCPNGQPAPGLGEQSIAQKEGNAYFVEARIRDRVGIGRKILTTGDTEELRETQGKLRNN
jgi:hypothetical protein